ncbi:unnamed protein product [Mortierella alpina]
MGSSLSKSKAKTKKKNRQSTSSVTTPSKSKKSSFLPPRRHSVAEGLSRPQNPAQWSEGSNDHNNYSSYADGQDQGPNKIQSEFDRSARNSGNSSVPQQSNISQSRTSTSAGRPSFSLLRGRRKSYQFQREEETMDGRGSRRQGQVLHISAPIIEPSPSSSGIQYNRELLYDSHATEPAPPRFQRPRQSLDSNRYEQQQLNPYVEPPRLRSGAYKAPVPSLPASVQSASASPPPPQTPTPPPPRPSIDSPAFPSPPHSSTSSIQEPQRLWRESLRNAAAVEGRKNEFGLVHTISNNSSTSLSSSGKGSVPRKHKPVSSSTFASSTLSSSSSNASQTSLGLTRQRSRRNNTIHPEGSNQPRLLPHQQRTLLLPQQHQSDVLDDNASTLSLAGSRYRRDGGSGEEDSSENKASRSGSRNASEMSLSAVAVGSGSPSLAGISQFSSPYLSTSALHQPSSPRSTPPLGKVPSGLAYEQQQQHQQGWAQPLSATSLSAIRSRAFHSRTAGSSARESMSSISTANYQWMEDQTEGSGLQDVVNRDSVMMLFNHSPNALDSRSLLNEQSASPTPEQLTQQHHDQQAQQHALLKYFFKGNYCAPLNTLDLGSVLDVGCGVGVWMKDMALEFPMTEVHGVDLAIPTRRRRHRVPASTSSSSNKNSPTTSEPSSAGASGIASHTPSASNDSMPSNCFFHRANITQGLPFPDNTFDYCHVRLVLWGYPLNSFPELLNELVRVTKKSGWIEFVDMDPCIKKATQPGTHINEWIKTGLIHSNMDPDLVKTLPKFLKEYCDATVSAAAPDHHEGRFHDAAVEEPYGLTHLKSTKISLPFGPWGGKVGELWQQSFTAFLEELEPMMVDAALSGLVMDQYHRQCQLEMQQQQQQQQQQAAGSAQVTGIDQSYCARMAWSRLIHQLSKDASATNHSASVPHSTHMSTSPSSATLNKDMRSYNNFYIVYAQKVDLMELRQVLLLQQLEQEILSPQPNMASSSTFSLVSAATFGSHSSKDEGSKQQTGDLNENLSKNRRLASTLREKLSSPNLHQRYLSSGSLAAESAKAMADETAADATQETGTGVPLSVLTRDALETFNRTNGHGQDSPVLSPSSSAVPPTPTSIAALSIRSSSRASNRNNSVSGGGGGNHAVGTPGSMASGSGSPRNNNAFAAYKRQGSVQSGLGSPQQPPTPHADGLEENGNRTQFEMDYFSQVPVPDSSNHYHHHSPIQQQQQQQQQLPTNAAKRKPSLLSRVLSPSVAGASAGLGAAAGAGASLVAKLQSQAEEEADREHIAHYHHHDPEQQEQQEQQQEQQQQHPRPLDAGSDAVGSFTAMSSDPHTEQPVDIPLATVKDTAVGVMAENAEVGGHHADDDGDYDDDEGSEIVIVLQDIDSDEAQSQRDDQEEEEGEAVELATESQSSPEGMVGVVPEYQVAISSQAPRGESVESFSAKVEHMGQEVKEVEDEEEEQSASGEAPLDQEHTIDIINRVSMGEDVDSAHSERTEESAVDESQLQMLAVDVDAHAEDDDEKRDEDEDEDEDEEVLVMMAPDESGPSVMTETEEAKEASDPAGSAENILGLESAEDLQDAEAEARTDHYSSGPKVGEDEDEDRVPLQDQQGVPSPPSFVEDMETKDEEVVSSGDTFAIVEDAMRPSVPESQIVEVVGPLATVTVGTDLDGARGEDEKEVEDNKDDRDDNEDEDDQDDEDDEGPGDEVRVLSQQSLEADGDDPEDVDGKAAETRKQKEKALLHPYPSSSASSSTPAPPPAYRFPASRSPYTMDPHHSHWQQRQHHDDRSRKEPEPHYPHEPSDPQDYYYHQHHQYHQQQRQHPTASYHTHQHSHADSTSYPRGDSLYGRRGHRYSTDSAAADTLLMLSAAAFMDPAAARSVMATCRQTDRRSSPLLGRIKRQSLRRLHWSLAWHLPSRLTVLSTAARTSTPCHGQDRLCPCLVLVCCFPLAAALLSPAAPSTAAAP